MPAPFILVASNSGYRRSHYEEMLTKRGYRVQAVSGGVQCLEHLQANNYHALVLESNLLWGGAEGVLAVRSEFPKLRAIPVMLIIVESSAGNLYRLSKYSIQGVYYRPVNVDSLAFSLNFSGFAGAHQGSTCLS